MGYSRFEYTYSGGSQDFVADFALGRLNDSDVTVYVQGEVDAFGNNVLRPFTWVDVDTVRVSTPLSVGDVVVINRSVPKTTLEIDLEDSGPVTRSTLVRAFKHLMMNVHELLDGRVETFTGALLDAVYGVRDQAIAAMNSALSSASVASTASAAAITAADDAQVDRNAADAAASTASTASSTAVSANTSAQNARTAAVAANTSAQAAKAAAEAAAADASTARDQVVIAGAVPQSRMISTDSSLTGGGTLATNKTLTVSRSWLAGMVRAQVPGIASAGYYNSTGINLSTTEESRLSVDITATSVAMVLHGEVSANHNTAGTANTLVAKLRLVRISDSVVIGQTADQPHSFSGGITLVSAYRISTFGYFTGLEVGVAYRLELVLNKTVSAVACHPTRMSVMAQSLT